MSQLEVQSWDFSVVIAQNPYVNPIAPPLLLLTPPIRIHRPPINIAIISPNGLRAAAITSNTITIYLLQIGILSFILEGNFNGSAAFSPDGRFIAVTAHRKFCIWDLTTGEPTLKRAIPSGNDWRDAIAWSPDGRWIVSLVYGPGTTRGLGVFDAVTNQPTRYIPFGNQEPLEHVEFSLNSTMIYAQWGTEEAIFTWSGGVKVNIERHKWQTEPEQRAIYFDNGWIIRERDGKRLCWVLARNKIAVARWENFFAVCKDTGRLDILQICEPPTLQTTS